MSNITVYVKRVRRYLPFETTLEYKTEGAAGVDLQYVGEEVKVLDPSDSPIVLGTGLCFEIPSGFEGQLRGRSSLSKAGIWVATGTIDSDYRGEVGVCVKNVGKEPYFFSPGDRIAQIVFAPVARATLLEVSKLSDTHRGTGGFGSTGR